MKSSSKDTKTIEFSIKKQEIESLQKNYQSDKLRLEKTADGSHKVLQYPNKTQKNVKKLKVAKDNFKKNLKGRKIIKFIGIFILLMCLVIFLNKALFKNTSKGANSQSPISTTQNTKISGSKFSLYSDIIEQSVKTHLGIKSKIKTLDMHKNGNQIFANGYYEESKDKKVYFDIILKNNNPISLIVDGNEYIK